ncbi:MAG: excinuclease ABC subunit UvrA [Deltaproteobacteria bacterium]|nr:excinuclease ABC subunit UvrA [Candidatus Anaeroferrophillus wilburensis]MBN2889234.1 excinuclease ABC subunit UvrA [Deltaproteobacteria bacterium]
MDWIVVKGAREHNLKNIDVEIPRNKLVVVTGLSGSGKSSLAFDTVYAEGQRRYVESLSAYARQFLQLMDKPDVDEITGLSPAIAIEQKRVSHNPRSTVGTVTEIYDYLRLLFARVGTPSCYQCGREIAPQTVSQIVDTVAGLPAGSRILILAPLVRGRKGEYRKLFADLVRQGFLRVEVDGCMYALEEVPELDRYQNHDIDLVVDRLIIGGDLQRRLTDSVELALAKTDGVVAVQVMEGQRQLFSTRLACVHCGISFAEISPRLFSFNNPHGACPRCAGLGNEVFFDPHLVVPNPSLSLREGAVAPWHRSQPFYQEHVLLPLARHYGFDLYQPFQDLSREVQDIILYGSGDEKIPGLLAEGRRGRIPARIFEGVIPALERKHRLQEGADDELRKYLSPAACPDCGGSRLKKESLHVTIGGQNIYQLASLSLPETLAFIRQITLPPARQAIASRVLQEVEQRLSFLLDVGLDYLTLARESATLSGGESQRIRLATQIGSGLTGVLYVLDEPSIGLHQRDNEKLLASLFRLRDLGNTLLVVEHDQDTIMRADHVIDMGPGAGRLGGEVVAQGTSAAIAAGDSLTGQYLAGRLSIEVPAHRRTDPGRVLSIKGASIHNLKRLAVDFPLGKFICVTGVSGSGKSSLVNDTLFPVLHNHLHGSYKSAGPIEEIDGLQYLDKVINIDQSPIGRTPRSNPATYTGVFTAIRELFAALPEARVRGYRPGRFSFNIKGGRCEACRGEGMMRVEMHFLPDVFVTCDTCGGSRFNRDTLEVHYKGKQIAEVLAMTVNQAAEFFAAIPKIVTKLQTLQDVGLGYIALGQAAVTLSGGEAQRVKLSRELGKRATGRTFYLLDEPTTGLHFHDVRQLLQVLQRLVDEGNTVLVVEHNLEVIKVADYLVDLGPEGGARGGELIACGTPEEVAAVSRSATGFYLRAVL